ncbi:MAG: GntR family transcriptional regulator [Solirubrobacteraceae bacterium]
MIIDVDVTAATPAYEQIRQQITTMIQAGTLAEGAQMPTIRQLAADLGLAPGTVARAYTELERAGLVSSRRRRGTVVAAHGDLPVAARRLQLDEAARAYALAVRRLGIGKTDAVRAAREQLVALEAP